MKPQAEHPETPLSSYLWDATGPVDLEIAALERTLRPLRYQARPRFRIWRLLVPTAVAALAALLVWLPLPPNPPSTWAITGNDAARPLHSGQVLVTGADASLRLHSPAVGSVTVEPNSRLRVLPPTKARERLSLEYGTLRAFIWAPPAKFAVETPSAMAVDLGCVYTLQTDRHGDGQLTVEIGWVALESGGAESFIPAGALCRIRKNRGPGLPVYRDAPATFKNAIIAFEEKRKPLPDESLEVARARDALTLWHLIPRTEGRHREQVVARFTALVKLPESIRPADLLHARPGAIDASWDALHLGSTDWWRTWKQEW